MGIVEQERSISKIGIDRLLRVRNRPRGLNSECAGIQGDNCLGKRLRILIARTGGDKDRVRGRVNTRTGPDTSANLPL